MIAMGAQANADEAKQIRGVPESDAPGEEVAFAASRITDAPDERSAPCRASGRLEARPFSKRRAE